jgi:uncharacterized protein
MHPLDQHRAARLAALTAPDGWLNLTDRIEVAPGIHSVGQGRQNDVVLSAGPAHLGTLTLIDPATASFASPGQPARPFVARGGNPMLAVPPLLLEIHTVEGRPALRVRDAAAKPSIALRYFPTDPAWVIRAAWEALDEPELARIDMRGGASDAVHLTHRARFDHDGREVVLTPTHWKDGLPMFVIRDATSGRETYGAARFLIGDEVTPDQITLDFNRAFNPPCAFTDHAICPLPPPGNVLAFRIEAGELAPSTALSG